MTSPPADVIVVGSGPSATAAAWPLVEAGLTVLMLDVGNQETTYAPLIPQTSFLQIRRGDPEQHRYFLGDAFEGIPFGGVRVGAQLTPPRQYIARDTDRLTPIRSSTFSATESLALGGLGSGWGASAVQFTGPDLEGFPIRHADLAPHYEAVAARIGISGERDDLLPWYGECASLQPPLEADPGPRRLLERYTSRRARFNRAGFFMGHPRLAVLTRDLEDRKAQSYHEMEFYADADRAVYRPWFTVERMKRSPGFTYVSPWLVESFSEDNADNVVEVRARAPRGNGTMRFTGRRLILAAGAMGTARIVLRSFGRYDTPLPLACNSHVYVPCVNFSMIGRTLPERRHSLTQAGIIFDPDGDGRRAVYVEVHGYRPLLLFKMVKEAPLAVPESFGILRDLTGALQILVIEHEDRPTESKRCILRRGPSGGHDLLEIHYEVGDEQRRREEEVERRLLRQVRRLGCRPIRRLDPGAGSSIHYGGPLPMTDTDRELTTTPSGRLRGTRGVYVADGSALPWLPAKPLTLTLMANADRVAKSILKEIR
ncbi:MAG TPA: GMC oxidoreductase [Candidatus Polarisedimenticolia bacterium]